MPLDMKRLSFVEYNKSKPLLWDPAALDLAQDVADWATLDAQQRDLVLRLGVLFLGGEEAVTHDLAPLLIALNRRAAPLEDVMFVTAQLYEESKHVEWFERWLADVPTGADLSVFEGGPAYRQLLGETLPANLNKLLDDDSDDALQTALVTYHMTIEGMLAETGYHAFSEMLKRNKLMPGLVRGIELVKRDEARHVAFGLFMLQELIRKQPDRYAQIEALMQAMVGQVVAIIGEIFDEYPDEVPFGLQLGDFANYAMMQFQARLAALQRARPA